MATALRRLLPSAPVSPAEAPAARRPAHCPRCLIKAPVLAAAIDTASRARVTVSSLIVVEAGVAIAKKARQAVPAKNRAKMRLHNDLRSEKSDHEHKPVLVLVADD